MLKKVILISALAAMTASAFGDLCTRINSAGMGTQAWKGTYTLNEQSYPVRMFLNYQNGMVYGYTMTSADSNGFDFGGSQPGNYLLWANCSNSRLTNLHFVNNAGTCGAVYNQSQPVNIGVYNPLSLNVPYQSKTIRMTLTPISSSTAQIVPQQNLLNSAMNFRNGGLQENLPACQ